MTAPLDPAQDPDRFRPESPDEHVPAAREAPVLGRTGGTRQTLPDLLAEGSFDDAPKPYTWMLGLLGTLVFLLLVAFVLSHLSP